MIPTVESDTINEARAITPDGKYVVGVSGPASVSADTGTGFLYNVTNGYLAGPIYSSDGSKAVILTGVAYRTVASQQELIVDGWSGGWRTDWMTIDGGTNWDVKVRNTGFPIADNHYTTGGTANSTAGGSTSTPDTYYTTEVDTRAGFPVCLAQCSNTWPVVPNWSQKGISATDTVTMNGVSGSGRAVGQRKQSGIRMNYMLTWNGTGTPSPVFFPGLDGTTNGEAFSVSADGNTIFGRSTVSGTIYGYKVINPGASQTINQLPTFPDVAGTTTCAPYGCSADGNFAVGMGYRSTEKAALWNTRDASPTNWTITDLTDIAAANGVLGDFIRLSRAYTIGVDHYGQKVIAGIGADSSLNTRAFVMVIPPAMTVSGSVGAGFTFAMESLTGLNYYLEYTTNLNPTISWTPVTSKPGTGSTISMSDLNPSGQQRFYHIKIQ